MVKNGYIIRETCFPVFPSSLSVTAIFREYILRSKYKYIVYIKYLSRLDSFDNRKHIHLQIKACNSVSSRPISAQTRSQ